MNISSALARVDLGTLGGASSFAADINDRDVVVGWSQTATGATHAFRWTAEVGMVDLGTLPGDTESRAVAILDGKRRGGPSILGISGTTPVVWSASGVISALPIPLLPDARCTSLSDFNARGDVVGRDCIGFGHGWAWSAKDGKYDLTLNAPGGSPEGEATAIASSGVVTLATRTFGCLPPFSSSCWRTYLWHESFGYFALGTPGNVREVDVLGLGMNDLGTVVGWHRTGGVQSAYRWTLGGGFTLLPHYQGDAFPSGYAAAVDLSGNAVGAEWEPVAAAYVASAWPTTGGIIRLSPEDPNPSVAVAINVGGTVAGWATVSDVASHAVIWEPASSASMNRAPADPVRRYAPRPSTRCLSNAAAITSRQALFDCVARTRD